MSVLQGGYDLRVLAVDDHPMMLDALVGILVDLDPPHEVAALRAATEADALLVVSDNLPLDLVLLDLVLDGDPDTDRGITRLRALRGVRPATPMVVFSAYGDQKIAKDASDAGAAAFIVKSATRAQILGTLRDVLHGRSATPVTAPSPKATGSRADWDGVLRSARKEEIDSSKSKKSLPPGCSRPSVMCSTGVRTRKSRREWASKDRPSRRTYLRSWMHSKCQWNRNRGKLSRICTSCGITAEHILGKLKK